MKFSDKHPFVLWSLNLVMAAAIFAGLWLVLHPPTATVAKTAPEQQAASPSSPAGSPIQPEKPQSVPNDHPKHPKRPQAPTPASPASSPAEIPAPQGYVHVPECPPGHPIVTAYNNAVWGDGISTLPSLVSRVPPEDCVEIGNNWFIRSAGPAIEFAAPTNTRSEPAPKNTDQQPSSEHPPPVAAVQPLTEQCPPGHPTIIVDHLTSLNKSMALVGAPEGACVSVKNSLLWNAAPAVVFPSSDADKADVPKLDGEIEAFFVAPRGEKGESCLITIWMKIKNTDAPSIADAFTMSVQRNGVEFPAQLLPRPPGKGVMLFSGEAGNSPYATLHSEDFLPIKAAANPIQNGGEVEGFFQWEVPGLGQSEIYGCSLSVHFADRTGKLYEAALFIPQNFNFFPF